MEMLTNLRLINEIFWEYSREFQYMGLVLVAVIYLYCSQGESLRGRRIACFTMLFFILLAVPPFVWLAELVLGSKELIRLLWMVPSVFLISYAAVLYGGRLQKLGWKLLFGAACILLVLLSGDALDEGGVFQKNENQNVYQVSEENLEICRILEGAGLDTVVLGANVEQIHAIRRVNAQTGVIYGADMRSLLLPDPTQSSNPDSLDESEYTGRSVEEQIEEMKYDEERLRLFAYMQSNPVTLELVMQSAQELGVNCIVFDKNREYSTPVSVLIEDGEGEILGETENYWVVKLLKL